MIYVAKKGEEEAEARRLSRRGFLSMLAAGTASLAVPKKSYFFFGNIARPAAAEVIFPEWAKLLVASGALSFGIVFGLGYKLAKS